MTVVGKILVFLNLVFSLVVGGFAVVDYTARTHWATAFKQLKQNYEVQQNAARLHLTESTRLSTEKEELYRRLAESGVAGLNAKNREDVTKSAERIILAMRSRDTTIDELSKRNKTLTDERNDALAKVAEFRASQVAYKTDIERRQTDSTQIRDNLKKEVDKNFQLTREMNQVRDEMVQAQIKSRTLEDYNRRLLTRVTELEKLRASGGIAGKGANTPPQDVEGIVRRSEGNLVTISLGSDNGLARGQMLEVFRLGQNARYIGKIRIEDVTPTQAVGQVVGRVTTSIQTGDRVASRIVGSN